MAKKIVNLRLSEEMIDLINQQIGDTFTERFENMVTRCMWELPAKEQQLTLLQSKIDKQRKRLDDLKKQYQKYSTALQRIVVAIDNL